MRSETFDLSRLADTVLMEKGFLPEFTEGAKQELEDLNEPGIPHPPFKDMRDLLWVSIDNDDSKDLDQLTYAEGNTLFVAVADVDALVKKGSEIDKCAAINTTSIYTPTKIFPMLPLKLSTDLTSLNKNVDRVAVVIEITLDDKGTFQKWDVYSAWVRNSDKLTYKRVGEQLEQGVADPQLTLQDTLAQKIKKFRESEGSLTFDTAKAVPVVEEGNIVGLKAEETNRANELIENFMIAANVAVAKTLEANGLPTLRRVVREPKRWDKIVSIAKELGFTLPLDPEPSSLQKFLLEQKAKSPDSFPDLSLSIIKLVGRGEYVASFPNQAAPGHFDLAVNEYAHTTAPNRRYPDLISQRILKSSFFNTPLPYTPDELTALAAHCTQKEEDANKVERRMLKSAAALALSSEVGSTYKAIVTGVNEKGTWVRIFSPPVEGMLVRGSKGLDVGDKLEVKLVDVNVGKGYLDFVRI